MKVSLRQRLRDALDATLDERGNLMNPAGLVHGITRLAYGRNKPMKAKGQRHGTALRSKGL